MADPISLATIPPVPPVRAAAAQAPLPANRAEAKKLAQDFEGVFAGQVVKVMMETAETRHDFTGGAGESMFRGLLAEQIGNQIAAKGGLGIAAAVEAQIIKMQEGSR
jgi:flagellar protein FlgJ